MRIPDTGFTTLDFKSESIPADFASFTSKLTDLLNDIYDNLKSAKISTTAPVATEMQEGEIRVVHNATQASRTIAYKYQGTVYQTSLGGDFLQGDWIVSTVTTAHSGWTNVSATYSNKFMRINATPLTTGGADTHTHAAGSFAAPAHDHGAATGSYTLTTTDIPAHTHGITFHVSGINEGLTKPDAASTANLNNNTVDSDGTGSTGGGGGHSHTITQQAAATITGTSAAGDNVPAYVQVVTFQKD